MAEQSKSEVQTAKSGEVEKEEKDDYRRCELSQGSFARTVTLPAMVDEAGAKAQLKDGMLEVTLPKTEKSRKRAIRIDWVDASRAGPVMPWSEERYPPAMAHLPPLVRAKAIEIANALLEEGHDEGFCIRVAIARAHAWARRRGLE